MQDLQAYVGKTVRVKWIKVDKRYGGKSTNRYMKKYRFKKARITEVIEAGFIDKAAYEVGLTPSPELVDEYTTYHIDLDDGKHFWTKEMFMFGKWRLKEK